MTDSPSAPKIYQAGTLNYTKSALTILFFWLLWGDVCYMLMESVTGPIMQVKFKELDVSNFGIGMLMSMIPAIITVTLNPIISFRSDRHRGPRGRRVPFIFYTLPLLVGALIGLAYGNEIGEWVYAQCYIRGWKVSYTQSVVFSYAFLLIGFTFFNAFVSSVFWYLFNDVVPENVMARFQSMFRSLAIMSAMCYSFFVFPYSADYAKEIFLGAALLYLVGFTLMLVNVREGQYPPPPAYVKGKSGKVAATKTYFLECHSHLHYWYLWIGTFLGSIGGGMGAFMLFYQRDALGLTMKDMGLLGGVNQAIQIFLVLGAGWLADRYHPIRVVLVAVILQLFIVTPFNLIWLFWLPAPKIVFWTTMASNLLLVAPVACLMSMWDPPLLMRLFPRSRYGQFCSTNNLWRMAGTQIVGASAAGLFLDIISKYVGPTRAYLYIPVWQIAFGIPGMLLFVMMYRSWKKYGGDHYVPPMIVETKTAEEQAGLEQQEGRGLPVEGKEPEATATR